MEHASSMSIKFAIILCHFLSVLIVSKYKNQGLRQKAYMPEIHSINSNTEI